MSREKIFVDTAFAQALLNSRDQYHLIATKLYPRMLRAAQLLTTEAVLIEIADALSVGNRDKAVKFIRDFRSLGNAQVVSVDTNLFDRGLTLYTNRPDKTWGLTDCVSFTVMQDKRFTLALTSDNHFIQAGFKALMIESS
jgi:predicted nucleic acid-binding protein